MVRLGDVVDVSATLTATRSRKAKVQALAALLGTTTDPGELGLVVGFLIGDPRQGRFGIGWSTLSRVDVPATSAPELTAAEVDRALDEIAKTRGSGSAGRRNAALGALLGRATQDEQRFLVALLTGELRSPHLVADIGGSSRATNPGCGRP